jgi:hypothetical protein
MLQQRLLPWTRKDGSAATALSLAILIALSTGALADTSAPDTPAGHTLQAFLEAFDSADGNRIADYVKQYDPQESARSILRTGDGQKLPPCSNERPSHGPGAML